MHDLILNDSNVWLPDACIYHILSGHHLLQQTCLLKAQSYSIVEDYNTNIENREFEDVSHNPATLAKLSIVAIRQHLQCNKA